jgi:hypothetical protein
MNTILKAGLITVCIGAFNLWLSRPAWTPYHEEKKYGPRLGAAASASTAWERYVALNDDWSPGAWCFPLPEPSALHVQWANQARAALEDALRQHDERALTYLYSREAAWCRVLFRRGSCRPSGRLLSGTDVLRTLAQESCASSAFELAELYLENDVLGEG